MSFRNATAPAPNSCVGIKEPEGEIFANLAILRQHIADAHDLISRLESRLAPILTSCPPAAKTSGTGQQIPASPLAENLRGDVVAARALCARLADINSRVDL